MLSTRDEYETTKAQLVTLQDKLAQVEQLYRDAWLSDEQIQQAMLPLQEKIQELQAILKFYEILRLGDTIRFTSMVEVERFTDQAFKELEKAGWGLIDDDTPTDTSEDFDAWIKSLGITCTLEIRVNTSVFMSHLEWKPKASPEQESESEKDKLGIHEVPRQDEPAA